jgi:hypothetical protein
LILDHYDGQMVHVPVNRTYGTVPNSNVDTNSFKIVIKVDGHGRIPWISGGLC